MLAALRICFLCCYDTKLLGGSFIYTCCSAWGGWPTGLMFCIPQTYRACCLIRTWNSVLDLILFVPIYLHLSTGLNQNGWRAGFGWVRLGGRLGWAGLGGSLKTCFVLCLCWCARCDALYMCELRYAIELITMGMDASVFMAVIALEQGGDIEMRR
ncbi:hypothetical protein V8E51_012069 [Hyaloscypha variabilis]